jgi:hypothetical protein
MKDLSADYADYTEQSATKDKAINKTERQSFTAF